MKTQALFAPRSATVCRAFVQLIAAFGLSSAALATASAPAAPATAAPTDPGPIAPAQTSQPSDAPSLAAESFVRVNATNQKFNFVRPWTKRAPFGRRGIGVIIAGNRVLVTAELVADHTYVELERPTDSIKSPANVVLIDHEANLAIIEPQDPQFLHDARPIEIAPPLSVGDQVDIVQIERNGVVATTPASVTTITVASYPVEDVGLLTYTVSAPLQYRDNSFTLPVLFDGRLSGLLMRYDGRSQTATLVPDVIIRGFLARAANDPYRPISRAGVGFAPTRDPQFRRYLEMEPTDSGVYIAKVLAGGAAAKSGLREGDVLLAVNGHDLDSDGNYADPQFGRIPFGHLVSAADPTAESVPLRILRDGESLNLNLNLEPRDEQSIVSPVLLADRRPRYFILGGVVFQELSRPYLEEWGSDWRENAPQKLVYLDAFQDELPADRGRIVFVSQILPTDATIGYEDLTSLVVTDVNGKPVRSLEDVIAAAEQPIDGFHKIEFDSDPGMIFLDANQVREITPQIQQGYGLPSLQYLGPSPTPQQPQSP